MSTLLLRLAGPMQSWGTQSRFPVRDTGLEPSKSGVIGLLCAALGRPRHQPVDDLAGLRMGVRVDQKGTMKRDYHTTMDVVKASGERPPKGEAVLSPRYYLADADFLVGLEGEDDALLDELHQALARPRWQVCLGRKAFPPGVPVYIPDGLRRGIALEEALHSYHWPRSELVGWRGLKCPEQLRYVIETDDPVGAEVRRDQPVGAAYQHRYFLPRFVRTKFCKLGEEVPIRSQEV